MAVRADSGARSASPRSGAAAGTVATIAHDLQTPVAVILGLCARIEAGGLTADQAADLERIRVQAGAISRGASEMLESALPARTAAQREPVDISAIVRSVADELAVLAHERGAIVVVSAPSPALVLGGSEELTSALTNLVTNALRQVNGGGCVRLSVRRGGGDVEVEVADSGPGVPETQRLRLLDPFMQGAGARGSVGLGLGIVSETARQLGGAIAVGEAPEGGAAFTLTLPEARLATRRARRRRERQSA